MITIRLYIGADQHDVVWRGGARGNHEKILRKGPRLRAAEAENQPE
ncbi:MAG: hypothetical protein KC621_09855 [Myxococcales bacterium]|nr:hypothetical protein [Myxococcales bacterium]